MNMQQLRVIFYVVAALVITTIGFGSPPTPQQALEYAKSVVLVKRVVQDNHIRSYVKEVWRFGSDAEMPPPAGSDYGKAMPYDSRMRFPERDAIVFNFGADRPEGLPTMWAIPVTEEGLVSAFQKDVDFGRKGLRGVDDVDTISDVRGEPMSVDEVRNAVRSTKPKPEMPNKSTEPASPSRGGSS